MANERAHLGSRGLGAEVCGAMIGNGEDARDGVVDGADAVEKIELLAEIDQGCHLDAAGPPDRRQVHCAEQNGVGLLDAFEGGGRARVAVAEKFAGADGVFDEVEADVRELGFDGAEDFDALGHNFGSDTVATEDRDFERRDHTTKT